MLSSLLFVSSIAALVSAAATCSAPSLVSREQLAVLNTTDLSPHPINKTVLEHVRTRLLQNATKSWELGTATQALIEYYWPEISVFNASAFPPIPANTTNFNVSDVIAIANRTVAQKSPHVATLVEDGQAGDPASLGIAVLYADYSFPDKEKSDAVKSQYKHLVYDVPRYSNGAISHRESEVQLWADFIAMAPPFIAYYGALRQNKTQLEIAYNQTMFYREILRDDETGLWKHIMEGSFQDESLWATGNAWAAWGMLRVHQTLNHSSFASEFVTEQNNLLDWVTEIVLSAWLDRDDEGLLKNTLGCDGPEDDFGDTASTALMTSVTYRLATIYANTTRALVLDHFDNSTTKDGKPLLTTTNKNPSHSNNVDDPFDFPENWSDSYTTANLSQPLALNLTLNGLLEGALEAADEAYTTIATTYLTKDGLLNGAVDPLTFTCQLVDGEISPEGQAFVLLMEAGRRDWAYWVNSTAVHSTDKVTEELITLERERVGIAHAPML